MQVSFHLFCYVARIVINPYILRFLCGLEDVRGFDFLTKLEVGEIEHKVCSLIVPAAWINALCFDLHSFRLVF